jgi:hypothetical protein
VRPRIWCVLIVLVSFFTALGCESGSSTDPSGQLTEEQRNAIAVQIIAGTVGSFLTAVVSGGQSLTASAVNGTTLGPPAPRSIDWLGCKPNCDSDCSLSCPVTGTYPCSAGGTITNEATVTGKVDLELTGKADVDAKQTYANCSPEKDLVINGDPYTTAVGEATFVKGQLSGTQTVHIGGAVKYVSGGVSGSCPVDIDVSYSPATMKGSANGDVCDAPVNIAF